MKSAISIGHCLQSHALAVFDLIGEDTRKTGARKILEWLKREPTNQFTRRDCHYALKSYFKKVDELQPCLDLLEDLNYVRCGESERAAHRPSLKYDVNPFIYEEVKED